MYNVTINLILMLLNALLELNFINAAVICMYNYAVLKIFFALNNVTELNECCCISLVKIQLYITVII